MPEPGEDRYAAITGDGTLTQHVAQARQLLRKVLADRLTVYEDSGRNRVSKGHASPEGFDASQCLRVAIDGIADLRVA